MQYTIMQYTTMKYSNAGFLWCGGCYVCGLWLESGSHIVFIPEAAMGVRASYIAGRISRQL